ncbi:hypothetical protein NLI96_g2751 [Meripilus lineatus]|uniref:Uncharacterized protein n=1 Tax=Meripilus lineatus TaxID=2056292 RepID=A0AAD5YJQ3_9APHY|nr:hypothetical protein NLI96_g2751 [Physisporinus lineatus]
MLYTTIIAAFASFVLPVLAVPQAPGHPVTITATWSAAYDNPALSVNGLACSDALIRKGIHTIGDLKNYPNVTGIQYASFGSPNCATCYKFTYQGKSVNVVAIDNAQHGATLSTAALNALTNGHAHDVGSIQATVEQVPNSACKL